MEEKSDLVAIGKLLDEHAYQREKKHIQIDGTIAVDFLGKEGTIHEIKKSRSIETAGIYQLKYYLYYLKKRGIENIKGEIDYPQLKQKLKIELTEADIKEIESIIREITVIVKGKIPPPAKKTKICKDCSYYELCYI